MIFKNVSVLILSGKHDLSTDRICNLLYKRSVNFLRINRDDLINCFLTLDPVSSTLIYNHSGYEWHVNNSLKSVWFRNPTFLRSTPGTPMSLQDQLIQSQWAATLR